MSGKSYDHLCNNTLARAGNVIDNVQGGESRGLNDRVHVISCRYSDKTCKKIKYISTNIYSIIMQ